ncbi:hypothetical protein HYDPIDRAFT_109362 [Hydnomerulius pinastri MD-312]|nr:hypothetical protein HYDPIDRAFT_109362 [Hydnomerulius pinastri MD-312]
MLARLSRHSARWLDVSVERALSSYDEDEETFSVDVNLASLVFPPDLSWSRVKGLCGQGVGPVYRSLKSVVEEDIEHVSKLLSELDPPSEEEKQALVPIPVAALLLSTGPAVTSSNLSCPDTPYSERPKRKRRRSSACQLDPLIIRPTDPSAPTIIITPCTQQPRETSCWVPYQDASFGARLTIPSFTAFNSVHPPMVAPINTAARIDNWKYTEGHWCAVIPPPDEQCRRGMFSRVAISRRRPRCSPSPTNDFFP